MNGRNLDSVIVAVCVLEVFGNTDRVVFIILVSVVGKFVAEVYADAVAAGKVHTEVERATGNEVKHDTGDKRDYENYDRRYEHLFLVLYYLKILFE